MKTGRILVVLMLGAALPVLSQPAAQSACDPASFEGCTFGDLYKIYWGEATTAAPGNLQGGDLREKMIAERLETNVATTAPDPFASRIHSSFQDFLNLLSFAVNEVDESEDGQALIVRFNPLRRGKNLLGLTFTITKPTIADSVSSNIIEDQRPILLGKIENERIEDLDDLSGALSYSRETPVCNWDKITRSRGCWGRSYRPYRQMLATTFASLVGGAPAAPTNISTIANAIPAGFMGNLFTASVLGAPEPNRSQLVAGLKQLAANDASPNPSMANLGEDAVEHLASLIENQPQLTAALTYRDPGTYGGPEEMALSVEYQGGFQNLNSLARDCGAGALAQCFGNRLNGQGADQISTGKVVVTLSYKRRSPFRLTDLGVETTDGAFTPIDLKSSTELKVRGQWGRQIDPRVLGENSRIDLALDGIRTEDDDVRNENRWVASATLTVPLGGQMSIPVSVTYANKPEFLGQPRKQFGMHLGLTYRLPWEKALTSQ